jgi:glycosyltransferase involved in cell wall biosynthesis
MKIGVLIPAFNEEKAVGELVRQVRGLGFDVLVIDDGSRDRTASLARANGAEVLINERNCGKGATLRRGFKVALEKGFDAVIVMDADGQHLPQDLKKFVVAYGEEKPGVIVGNRMAESKGMPLLRWWTNSFMSYLISRACGQRVPDSQCGYRLIAGDVLRKIDLQTDNFEIESEILLEAARQGARIVSVPIATVYDGQKSAIHPAKDTWRFIKFMNRMNRRRP